MSTYTLIAYQPNSNDGGYDPTYYDSVFVFEQFDEPDPLLDRLARLITQELEHGQDGFMWKIMRDGDVILDDTTYTSFASA